LVPGWAADWDVTAQAEFGLTPKGRRGPDLARPRGASDDDDDPLRGLLGGWP
jgi:hypothetical protein